MDIVNTFGMIAGIVSAVAFLPQVIKVWHTKSTKDISAGMYSIYCLGLLLWGIYAWMIKSWPLLITEAATGVMTIYILLMKLKK